MIERKFDFINSKEELKELVAIEKLQIYLKTFGYLIKRYYPCIRNNNNIDYGEY